MSENSSISTPVLLPLVYGGNTLYYALLLQAPGVFLDQEEHFEKRTWRNRMRILSSNGPLDLVVPTRRKGRSRTPVKELRIVYDNPWPSLHWRSITSAYRTAPYFEFFEDHFRTLYEKRFDYLIDLNLAFMERVSEAYRLELSFSLTRDFEKAPEGLLDLRYRPPALPEEKADAGSSAPIDATGPYPQVFDERFDYLPNLSVIDLLFNEGPEGLRLLRNADLDALIPSLRSL
jgi:hypothetical protein